MCVTYSQDIFASLPEWTCIHNTYTQWYCSIICNKKIAGNTSINNSFIVIVSCVWNGIRWVHLYRWRPTEYVIEYKSKMLNNKHSLILLVHTQEQFIYLEELKKSVNSAFLWYMCVFGGRGYLVSTFLLRLTFLIF